MATQERIKTNSANPRPETPDGNPRLLERKKVNEWHSKTRDRRTPFHKTNQPKIRLKLNLRNRKMIRMTSWRRIRKTTTSEEMLEQWWTIPTDPPPTTRCRRHQVRSQTALRLKFGKTSGTTEGSQATDTSSAVILHWYKDIRKVVNLRAIQECSRLETLPLVSSDILGP